MYGDAMFVPLGGEGGGRGGGHKNGG